MLYQGIGKCEQKAEIQRKLVHTIRNAQFSVRCIFCITKKLPKVKVCHSNPDYTSKDIDRNGRLHTEEERSQTKQPTDNRIFVVLAIPT